MPEPAATPNRAPAVAPAVASAVAPAVAPAATPDSRLALAPGASWRAAALLFVLAVGWFSLGSDGDLWARDEPRYAGTARNMLDSGAYIVPYFNGQPRLFKPPGIYWLQAASMAVLGSTPYAARLPSILAAAFLLAWLFVFVWRLTGRPRAAWLTALALGTSVMVAIQARAATIDAVLVCVVTVLLTELYALRRGNARPWRWLTLGVLVAASLLLKGPVVFAVVGPVWLAAGIWDRARRPPGRLRAHAPWIGSALMLTPLLAVPWFVAVNAATDGQFLRVALGEQVGNRLAGAMESHGGIGWSYLPYLAFYPLVLLVLGFPWSIVPIARRQDAAGALPESAGRFIVAWLVAPLVVFSLVPTKLFHYVLPVFPALAVLAGVTLDAWWRRAAERKPSAAEPTEGKPTEDKPDAATAPPRPRRWPVAGLVLGFITLLLGAGPPIFAAAAGLTALVVPAIVVGAVFLALGALGVRAWFLDRPPAFAGWFAAALATLAAGIVLWLVPVFDANYKAAPPAGAYLKAHAAPSEVIGRFGYVADTLPWTANHAIEDLGRSDLALLVAWLDDSSHRWLVLGERRLAISIATEPDWRARVETALAAFTPVARFSGRYDYEHGWFVDVRLYRRQAPAPESEASGSEAPEPAERTWWRRLVSWDRATLHWLNRWLHEHGGRSVRSGFEVANGFGVGWILVPIGLALIAGARSRFVALARMADVFVSVVLASGVTTLVKHAVHRLRPPSHFSDLYYAFDGPLLLDSFPSGHTTFAFALATVLTRLRPRWAPLLYAGAGLTGLARIYAGVHFPADVIAGAIIGAGFGWLAFGAQRFVARQVLWRTGRRLPLVRGLGGDAGWPASDRAG